MTDINLSPYQVAELTKCTLSPEYFAETYGWIQQKASAGVSKKTSTIPFTMGDTKPTRAQIENFEVPEESQFYFQREILSHLHNRENVLTVKSRRVGCSWVAAMYVAWLINFHEDVSVAFISETGEKAKDILKKVEFILKNLAYHDSDNIKKATKADWLRGKFETCNKERIEIAWHNDQGEVVTLSSVVSLTNTDDSARSGDYTFIVFDELDFYVHPDITWASATTSLTRGGHWMAISTPNQMGFVFHRMCSEGQLYEAGKLDYKIDFKYIEVWASEAGITKDEIKKRTVGYTQELIDKEWNLKWITPGTVAFDPTHLAVCYKPPEFYPEIARELEAYRYEVFNPTPNKQPLYYYSGGDTSKGNPNKKSREKDYHAHVAMTKSGIQANGYISQEPLSSWAGKVVDNHGSGVVVKGKLSKLHEEFPGYLQIEEEGPGYTAVNNHQIPNDTFSRMNPVSMKNKFKKGAVERLIIKVESHQIVITDLATFQQMSTFQKGSAPGSYEAAVGYNDDLVVAMILAEDARDQEGGMEFSFGASAADPKRAEELIKSIDRLPVGPMVSLNIPQANRRYVDEVIGEFGRLPDIGYDTRGFRELLPEPMRMDD